jgi:hypothetical protein
MSQQEFVSRSQGEDAHNGEEGYNPQHPYNWSPNKTSVPRDEPPSSYDEPMIQRGYRAQDYSADHKSQERTTGRTGRQQAHHQQFGPDGDAYERGYRISQGYNAWQGVPPWARVQPRQRGFVRAVVFIVLGLMLIGPILHLLGGILLFLIGAVFLGLLIACFVLIILGILFISRLSLRRRSSFPPWRGRWGW